MTEYLSWRTKTKTVSSAALSWAGCCWLTGSINGSDSDPEPEPDPDPEPEPEPDPDQNPDVSLPSSGQIFIEGAEKDPWLMNQLRLDIGPCEWFIEQQEKKL